MIKRLFLEHPHSVEESYFEHMAFAGWFAYKLGAAACAALVHAILPFCFETTASRIINELHDRIHDRDASAGKGDEVRQQAA